MHSTYVRIALERSRRGHKRRSVARSLRDVCRKIAAFLFTQVGVCALVVGYTIFGAIVFRALEGNPTKRVTLEVLEARSAQAAVLWNLTFHYNVLHRDEWSRSVDSALVSYQRYLVAQIKRGYEDPTGSAPSPWSFPAALFFCLTVYSTIGYGNLAPQTVWGKIATILYALLGIPLILLYMTNMGDALASSFKYTYSSICKCTKRPKRPKGTALATISAAAAAAGLPPSDGTVLAQNVGTDDDPETVSVTSCLFVMLSFVGGGAILFSTWEGWNFVDGFYFSFTSLLTIGFGDLIPGTGTVSPEAVDYKLILCVVYLLLGMALLAMCFNLAQEEVFMKIKRVGRRLGLLRQNLL